jgi:hypothetical protein
MERVIALASGVGQGNSDDRVVAVSGGPGWSDPW